MSKDIIKAEIDSLFEAMREQWEIIKRYEDKIPYIELDILRENIRKLYEDVRLIDKLNKTPGIDIGQVRPQPVSDQIIRFEVKARRPFQDQTLAATQAEVVESPSKSDLTIAAESDLSAVLPDVAPPVTQPEEIISPQPPHTPQAEPTVEPEINPVPAIKPDPVTTAAISKETADAEPLPSPATLAEKYRDDRKSLIDIFNQGSEQNSLGSRMQHSQISDLKTAIGINDKFLFINELFKGDLAAYNRAITNLNSSRSKNEALYLIDQMLQQYRWILQSASVVRLKELVLRRFAE